ncbi:MAG: ROK family protein [Erysipelotrichaceae bacterium]|nr:ROK family protein [Erysipelotrichaceae bacterium]
MEYFVLDVGGSSIKYAVMDENQKFIRKGKAESRHLQNSDEFVSCLSELYREAGACAGGIAVSYCGEVDAESGLLHSGGSYRYMAGLNLKELLEEKTGTTVSIENDGNCAGLAESRYGSLRGYTSAAAVVIGTGLGGALILNNALYRGVHGYAGSASLMVRNFDVPYTKQQWAFRTAGAAWPGKEYGLRKGIEAVDGITFFEAVKAGDKTAEEVLKDYCSTLANVLFDLNIILDLEAIAIGGGISQQPILLEYLQKAFDQIYSAQGMAVLNLPRPEIRVCQYHNDANLLGALAHHLDRINKN